MNTEFRNIHEFISTVIRAPIKSFIANNIFGSIITVFAIVFMWMFGINGEPIVSGLLRPFWFALQEENLDAITKGLAIPNIVTEQFFDLVWIGGAGATFIVSVYLMFRAKSKQYREIGKISVLPGLFNINEPILFGLPIVFNPFYAIPFMLGPVVVVIINYLAMHFNIVARPTGVVVPWTTPPIIQGFLITNDISGAILQIIDMLIIIIIWIPFLNIMDKHLYSEEQNALK